MIFLITDYTEKSFERIFEKLLLLSKYIHE